MKKIEFIWRHILFETIEKKQPHFQQQQLAAHFSISSSTVNAALTPLRRLGGIRVGGRGFDVVDYEKILYHWANIRRFQHDIAYSFRLSSPIPDIEGQLPPGTIPAAFSAVRERFGEPPADYDAVYCYHSDPNIVHQRFINECVKGKSNVFVLQADPFLSRYPSLPLAQLFVDLWNITDWYAKDFLHVTKEAMDGLLS
jgi:hypothetical protein